MLQKLRGAWDIWRESSRQYQFGRAVYKAVGGRSPTAEALDERPTIGDGGGTAGGTVSFVGRIALVVALVVPTLSSAALATTRGLVASPPGKVIGQGAASGMLAVAHAHGTVKKPKALYAKLVGNISSGTMIVSCSKGSKVSTNTYVKKKAGLYSLPIKLAMADKCTVTASIGGNGSILVQISAVT